MFRNSLFAFLLLINVLAFAQQYEWSATFGGTSSDFGQGLAVDQSANVYITGHFWNTVDFDPGPGTTNLTSAGDQDIYFLKLDATGNLAWVHRMGNAGRESGEAVAVDDQGNIYFTGYFNGTIYPDRNNPSTSLISTNGNNLYVVKLDSTGSVIWARQTTSNDRNAFVKPYDIEIGPNGNIYISGAVKGGVRIGGMPMAGNTGAFSDGQAFVIKLNSSGNYVLHNQIFGTGSSNLLGVAIDSNENIYAAGMIEGQANYTHPVQGRVNLSASGRTDIVLCRFHANGDYDWFNAFGNSRFDSGNDVALDGNGNLYVTGHFALAVDFNPDTTSTILTAVGRYNLPDVFMARYKVNGDLDWVKQMGTFNSDKGKTILLDDSCNIYLGGDFEQSADFDPGPNTFNLFAYGNEEVFTAKYDSLGNFIWAEAVGGNGYDFGADLFLDDLGDLYACGSFSNNMFFNRSSPSPVFVNAVGFHDIYVLKYRQSPIITVGLDDLIDEAGFRIYPNPTEGNLTIDVDGNQLNGIRIFNMQGRLVYERENSNHAESIQLDLNYEAGIYFLQLITPEGFKSHKIILK